MAKQKSSGRGNFSEGVEKVMEVISESMKKSGALAQEGKSELEGGKKILEKEVNQIIAIAKHLKSNWKTTLPAIAAVGAGAYFLNKKKPGKKSAKAVSKKASKPAAKKKTAKAKSKKK